MIIICVYIYILEINVENGNVLMSIYPSYIVKIIELFYYFVKYTN